MRTILLVLCHCMVTCTLFGQTFSGNIIDKETAKPVPFARVFISTTQVGTVADSLGRFQFDVDLPLTFEIRVRAEFYKTVLLNVNLSSSPLTISLESTHLDMEDVVVSTPKGGLAGNNVFKVNKMDLNELNLIQSSNLSEALANMNGVQVSSVGAGISKPVIRGMQGLRVLNLVNGVRINNQQWGGDHGLAISELGIGSVELIKGPSSLLYGSDALGGVIYLVDAAYPSQGKQNLSLNTQYETVNAGSKTSFIYGASKGKLRFMFGGLYGTYADYQLPNGKYLKNSRYNQLGGKFAMTYNKKNWVSHLRYSYSRFQTGLPGHSHDSIIDPLKFQSNKALRSKTLPNQLNELNVASFENKFFFNQNELQVLLSYTRNQILEHEEKVTIPGIGMFLDNYAANLRFTHVINEKNKLIYGYQGLLQVNQNNTRAEEQLIPNFDQQDHGLYSILYFKLGKTDFQLGGRLDHRTLQVASDLLRADYLSPNFAFGFVRKVTRHLIRLNISTGYRAPHVSELLSNGVHHAALRYEIGDRNLKPEYSTQLDFDYELEGEHLSLVVNPFYNQIFNYISIAAQDSLIDGVPVFNYISVKEARLYGIDLGLHYHPHFAHFLHFETTYSYVRGEDGKGNNLDLIPQGRINTLFKFLFEGKAKRYIQNLALQHEYYFDQTFVSQYETPSQGYHLINLGVNGELGKKQHLLWSLGVKNLLNESYINHLSRLKNINTAHPGRSLYVGLTYQL